MGHGRSGLSYSSGFARGLVDYEERTMRSARHVSGAGLTCLIVVLKRGTPDAERRSLRRVFLSTTNVGMDMGPFQSS